MIKKKFIFFYLSSIIQLNLGFIVEVRASVLCNITSNNIDFGDINTQYNNQIKTVSTITVECRNDSNVQQTVNYTVKFNLNSPRNLKNKNNNIIPYNIYYDYNFSQILGDGTNGSRIITNSYILSGLEHRKDDLPLYAKIIPSNYFSVYSYTDTVIITLDY